MIKLLHVISGLGRGGAEMMLCKLLSATDRSRFSPSVLSLSGESDLAGRISKLDIPVEILGMRRGLPRAGDLLRLVGALERTKPALIQTWMYHADLAVGLSGFLRKLPPLVWGIRGSSPRSPAHRRTTKLTIRMSALLSRWVPRRILFCSQRSRLEHIRFGYDRRKSVVIPNGFDLQTYRPSRESRSIVRQQLGISEDAPLIGMVARYHPQKDHPTFIRAAAILLKKIPQAQFLLCGQNVTAHNPALAFLLKEEGVERHFHLLGNRDDIPQLTAALDIASLSSSSIEAFPNVIGEAMACGISCVATDVGDTALIIGDTGVVVPPSDPAALAGGWHTQMSAGLEHRRKQGRRAFQRVRSEFSIDSIARRYEKFYLELLSETPR